MRKHCPGCHKDYDTDLPEHPSMGILTLSTIYPDAEPWQREQLKTGYCSDKCYDESIQGVGVPEANGYNYDEKGRRFKDGYRALFLAPS